MKIKQFEASTEKEAMLRVKEELGKEALIVSVKNIKPKGVFKVFRKSFVQVTAALDDRNIVVDRNENQVSYNTVNDEQKPMPSPIYYPNSLENLEKKIKSIEQVIGQQKKTDKIDRNRAPINQETYENTPIIKLLYEQLLENEVSEQIANRLMKNLKESLISGNIKINNLISIVYKRIIKELGDIETIKINRGKSKVVLFIGPTGVGKTTTIAKIASHFTISKNMNVGLITADTYRIAAVEQLRTYANILDIPVEVVYSNDEIQDAINRFKDKDLVLIDTAGRSHKNKEQEEDIKELIEAIPEKEVYLVLSITTKYKDLTKITDMYSQLADYKVIFTKLDESICYGNMLNVKEKTGAKLSYITFGQNVPDDISEINSFEIARSILGGQE